jgi:Tfp pilus assembly protein PilZ
MAGNRSILHFKPLERLHLIGTLSLGSTQFIACKVVAIANLLLNRALNVAKGVFWIAPARTAERVPQKP